MSCASRGLKGLAAAVVLSFAALAPAQAASLLEKNFWLEGPQYDGALPACEAALSRISDQFADTQHHFWANNVAIVGYEHVSVNGANRSQAGSRRASSTSAGATGCVGCFG